MNECIRSYPRNDMTWQAMTRCYLSVAESLGPGRVTGGMLELELEELLNT